MPSFEKEFIDAITTAFSEGKGALVVPIKYRDFELISMDRIPVPKKFSGTVKLISTNSEWQQAVCLDVLSGKLKMEFGESKKVAIWEDHLNEGVVHFEGTTKDLQLLVYNAWQQFDHLGTGFTNYWKNGAAMIVEVDGNTRRYKCNDGHPDDNFDDIVFEITINE
jgi:hypothetical protein